MQITSQYLPTMGRDKGDQTFTLRPLTYKEIYDYINNEELSPIRYFIKDLKLLESIDPNLANASILDATYLIYLEKALTISEELSFNYSYKCPHCGKIHKGSINSQSIVFRDIDQRYLELNSIVLQDTELPFKIPTISEFISFASRIPRKLENIDINIIKLASLFSWMYDKNVGYLIDKFLNATRDEIKLITLLKSVYFELIEPIKVKCEKGGETVVALGDVTTDMFHLLLSNTTIDRSKIQFKQAS